jgi:NADH:ubiquinone oxidoreductase subunit 6 (subunit J)
MMAFGFSIVAMVAVCVASFVSHIRHAILALWVAGLSTGALYLVLGVELLAVVQWVMSTLVTIAFIFFSVMFGEYGRMSQEKNFKKSSEGILFILLSSLLGGVFSWVMIRGSKDLPGAFEFQFQKTDLDLGSFGSLLVQDHWLSLEVIALTLFLVLIGGGVAARLQGEDTQ